MDTSTAILWPMFCLIGLTFFTLLYMFYTRVTYMLANKIHPQRVQNRGDMRQLLQPVMAPSDHFNNLLELPLLFYIAVILIWVLRLSDGIYLLIAWLYVCLRLAHSVIHLGYNRVMHRLYAFAASSLVLFLIWLRLALHIIER
jgi:hypothetical protein